nr:hypothetical protein CFP56_31942 [Quercus suber]
MQNGKYTCKSSYQFFKEEAAFDNVGDPPELEKELWKGIWALESPNKVKNLIWRTCRNSFPTKSSLVQHTIIPNPTCDRCEVTEENPLHALLSCSELEVICIVEEAWDFRSQVVFLDFKALTAWILKNNKVPELLSW